MCTTSEQISQLFITDFYGPKYSDIMSYYCERKKYTKMIKLPQWGAAVAFNECLSQWSDPFPVICMM